MSIKIKRNTKNGALIKLKIKISGQENVKIAFDETIEVPLDNSQTQISVSQFAAKKEMVDVNDGDFIEITEKSSTNKLYWAIFIVVFFAVFFTTMTNLLPVLFVLFPIIILIGLNYNPYHLTVMESNTYKKGDQHAYYHT